MSTAPLSVIVNAELYAPEYLGVKSLLVGGGKILAISDEPIILPKELGAEMLYADGRKLIPGYIDSHAHITGGGGEAGFSTQVPPVPVSDFTNAGVTTVVGLLGTDDLTRTTGNMLARVYGLREEGLTAYCWTGGYHLPLTTLTGSAKSDIVYLEPVIGVGEFAISDHRSSQPTFEEVIRLASETHVAGLMTGKAGVLHFHLGDGDRKLEMIERAINETELPARTFNPTHVNRNKPLFDHACELAKRGVPVDITAFPANSSDPGWSAYEAIELAIKRDMSLDKFTVSSDGGGCLPSFDCCGTLTHMDFGRPSTLHETVLECLANGIELETILPLFTSNVADVLRFGHKGRVQVGADADLIILDEQNQVSSVMAMGRWHKKRGEQLVKGTFE